jgi:hypothetical protein
MFQDDPFKISISEHCLATETSTVGTEKFPEQLKFYEFHISTISEMTLFLFYLNQ